MVVPETADTPAVLYIDLHLTHEVTSPQAFDVLRARGLKVRRPDRTLATMDHSTPTDTAQIFGGLPIKLESAAKQVRQLEVNCAEFGVELIGLQDARRGIVHIIGPELGATQPGKTIVCGDSHTSTHGAFGALAFGIGTTEVGHVLATQCLLQRKPKTLEVVVNGKLPAGRDGQGRGARHHRQDRRQRRHRPRHRVPRRHHRGDVDGRAHDRLQHVDRGRRARRHDRAGRHDLRLPEGPARSRRRARPGTQAVADWQHAAQRSRARRSTSR